MADGGDKIGDGSSVKIPSQILLFGGENGLAEVKDVTYLCPYRGPVKGTLWLTNFRMFFLGEQFVKENGEEGQYSATIEVLLGCVEKIGGQTARGENSYRLEISCKDLRNLRFAFASETQARPSFVDLLQTNAFPLACNPPRPFYAFSLSVEAEPGQNGWQVYDPVKEYERLGVPNQCWRFSDANKAYEICSSYPSVLMVPISVTDETLKAVSKYRSKGRIPSLSWIHPTNHATITRCSQPMVGLLQNKSQADVDMIEAIRKTNPNDVKLMIMDARPRVNAVGNQVKGAGFEDMSVYTNIELVFLNIANIHGMRDSMRKLRELCAPSLDDTKWLSLLEATHWLDHVKLVLAGAARIVDLVDRCSTSVLIHCSDGWDRTSQLSSISMLLLDAHYREIKGFQVLIEKEWLSFGHKFAERLGHGEQAMSDERSPIFVQFIDCVWQLTQQFPCAFEFNENFLITILDHLYSCLFGTFLYNTEQVRAAEKLKERTTSLWTHINKNIKDFTNPLYCPLGLGSQVLTPVCSMRRLQLWTAYYARWNPRVQPQESVASRNRALQDMCELLKENVAKLKGELSKASEQRPE
eukprot:Colp12_sorted_trinity150504_noHs@13759